MTSWRAHRPSGAASKEGETQGTWPRPAGPLCATFFKAAGFSIALGLGMGLAIAQVSIEPRQKTRAKDKTNQPDFPRTDLRVDSNLVLVPVEVSDLLNRPVSGLEKSHFRVFDEKIEQTIVSFAMEDDPIAIGLVFDVSGSMGGEVRQSPLAAQEFFKTANPGDEFCLVVFDSAPRLLVPLTEDPREIDYQLMFTKSRGSTALIDAIYLALNQKRSPGNRERRLSSSPTAERTTAGLRRVSSRVSFARAMC